MYVFSSWYSGPYTKSRDSCDSPWYKFAKSRASLGLRQASLGLRQASLGLRQASLG